MRVKSNTQAAVERLRELIFSGELPAGSQHLETELADRLGMSRTPVREASLMLAGQGLVEVRPRRGVWINSVSAQDMVDIYEILTELECLAAQKAAQSGYTTDDLVRLHDCLMQMEDAAKTEDRDAWSDADDAFHGELVRLGGNARVEAIVANFNDQVRRARSLTLHLRPFPTKSNEDHRAVYEAIARGDAATARWRHREHRTYSRDLLVSLIKKHRLGRL